jgi:hypothetical protein
MNLKGSYRALCSNSKAAMLSAIEIYNKPQIAYRDECFVILVVNAWELLLKAILSKNQERIFYPKERQKNYRTFTIQDALNQVKKYIPPAIQYEPIAKNLMMIVNYRNDAIHFYNQTGFGIIIYGLAQTSIINFRDLMLSIFKIDISNEMSVNLLPLAFGIKPDPIEFLQKSNINPPKNKTVARFLKEIAEVTSQLEANTLDTGRFLTVFQVKMQSVKKVSSADIVIPIASAVNGDKDTVVERPIDPNICTPLPRRKIKEDIGDVIEGMKFSNFVFEAIVWKYIKPKRYLWWQSDVGRTKQYSNEVPSIIRKLSREEILSAIDEFKKYGRERLIEKRAGKK